MDKPLRLRAFRSSEGSPDITLTLNRPVTDEEAHRIALAIDACIERESANLICDCGKRMGEHPAQAPWWPCMKKSAQQHRGEQ